LEKYKQKKENIMLEERKPSQILNFLKKMKNQRRRNRNKPTDGRETIALKSQG